jgi:hypothetical protein
MFTKKKSICNKIIKRKKLIVISALIANILFWFFISLIAILSFMAVFDVSYDGRKVKIKYAGSKRKG